MKFSENWLRTLVNPTLSTTELTEKMSMMGLTVDHIFPVAGKFSNVVVGKVISTKPHPNASKLTCCEVDVGEKKLLHIVCGASNVRANLKVAVAKVGAILPGNKKIESVKLRGESSEGMICSAHELNLHIAAADSPGILELPNDAPIGKDFCEYFQADDHIIDVEITPNRGDCLSILGVARDITAQQGQSREHKRATHSTDKQSRERERATHSIKISVLSKSDCPRYVGCHIRNINNKVETPSWMQHRLQCAGVRLINPIVDIGNYVMCELGQPMHAFDFSKLSGDIQVRRAKSGEKINLLDEQTITLTMEDLVIADQQQARCLAGIMGGMSSAVTSDTAEIFLEAAFFSPKTICLSVRRHNVRSDASHRFERGVDFNLPMPAMERAIQLILEITGGSSSDIVEVVSSSDLPKRDKIILRRDQIQRILGVSFSDEKISQTLQALGMQIKSIQSGWEVLPPSYRFDINLEIDLIEECARILGYDRIPVMPIQAPLTIPHYSERNLSDARIRTFFADRGYRECITYSFISPELQTMFFPHSKYLTLKNPLSNDLSVMRTSLWPSLLQTVEMNARQQCERVRLFEMGLCFLTSPHHAELSQVLKLGCAVTGRVSPEQWGLKQSVADFYDLKSDVEALLSLCKNKNMTWQPAENSACHPGRCAALYHQDQVIGFLGEVHPVILQKLGLRESVIVFEVLLSFLTEAQEIEFKLFSRFPSIRRDLAIILDDAITASKLQLLIQKNAGNHLKEIRIFDVYKGVGIPAGKKSVALGLTFQDASRTLRDEEINEIIQNVVTALERELQATLRV